MPIQAFTVHWPLASYAQTRRPSALFAQTLNGVNNSGCDFSNRPVSIHFGKASQGPVMLDHRRGRGLVSAHALLEDLFRVVGSLGQRGAVHIAKTFLLRRFAIDVINALADRTIPAP